MDRNFADAYETGRLFTLRVPGQYQGEPMVIVHAFDSRRQPSRYGHTYIDIEVRQGGKVIFGRGQLYCGVPAGQTTDGRFARTAVLETVAMAPGDTDADYFVGYTDEQLDWARRNGEHLTAVSLGRR